MLLITLLHILITRSLDRLTFSNVTSSKFPAVVRFFADHRPRSAQLNQDWDRFEQMYRDIPDIYIARVNCGKHPRLCLRETAWDQPRVRLYINNSARDYVGGMSYESLSAWTENSAGVTGTRLDLDLLSPNNRTFHELLAAKHCVLAFFHSSSCQTCQKFMSPLLDVARAFKSDNVSVCEVDVDKFRSFFFDYNLRELPALHLFTGDAVHIYGGEASAVGMATFVNEHCGTNRIVT